MILENNSEIKKEELEGKEKEKYNKKNLEKYGKNKESKARNLKKSELELEEYRPENGKFFDKSDWLTTKEAAIYLRKFSIEGTPSENAVHKLVSRGCIRRRKFGGRLFFRRNELDFLIDSSVA